MATELWGLDVPMQSSPNVTGLTFDANGNYSSGGANQYAVLIQDTGTANPLDVRLPTAASQKAIGVLMNGPLGPNQAADVRVHGIAKCRASAAIAKGDTVMIADTSGQVATATAATANFVVGEALEAASGAGVVIMVLLAIPKGKVTMP